MQTLCFDGLAWDSVILTQWPPDISLFLSSLGRWLIVPKCLTKHIFLLSFIPCISDKLSHGTLTPNALINKLTLSSCTVFISNVEQDSYPWQAIRDYLQLQIDPFISALCVVVQLHHDTVYQDIKEEIFTKAQRQGRYKITQPGIFKVLYS